MEGDPVRKKLRRMFYGRPLFWAALSAMAGIGLAWGAGVPTWLWVVLFALAMVAVKWRPAVALVLGLAAVYGGLTAYRMEPPVAGHLREGAPITLRGVIRRDGLPEHGRRALLDAAWRRSGRDWVRQPGRFGVTVPYDVPLEARPGDLVEVSGLIRVPPPATYPGGPNQRLEWLRRGVHCLVRVRPRGYVLLGHQSTPAWKRLAERGRTHILTLNRATLPPRAAHIANDFLIGDEAPPDPELAEELDEVFRDSGTIHLLVVSGTQVALVLGLFVWMGQRLHRYRFWFWVPGALALGAYYLLTDGAPPVTRAVVMGGSLLLGRALDREADLENCLGLSALLLLLPHPLGLFDLGFQLSFMAVWALIRLAGPLQESWTALLASPAEATGPMGKVRAVMGRAVAVRWLVGGLSGCVAAHLGVTPLLEYHFQRSSWSAILANLPMLAVGGLLMYACLAHVLAASLGWTLLVPVVTALAEALLAIARFFARPPLGAAGVFPPPLWLLPLLALGVAVPSWLKRGWAPVWATTVLGVAVVLSERMPASVPSAPTVRVLDVGQGDAVLLQGTDGSNILVDAGPPVLGRNPVVRALRSLRVGRLDAVLVSHPHADHVGGLPEVLEAFPVGAVLHDVPGSGPEPWRPVVEAAKRRSVPLVPVYSGDRLRLGAATLNVLGPLLEQRGGEDENEGSVVARWEQGRARMLLTGDAPTSEELSLLRWRAELRAEVLKVAHHGSAGSSALPWLRAVRPELAVLSCGRDNRYGHPSSAALGRFKAAGVPVARTDEGGMVTVRLERGGVRVETFRAPR